MIAIRTAVIASTLAFALGACSREEPTTAAGAGNALLDYVPADTPYLAANLEPLPEDVVDAYLQRLQPVFDEMQTQLSSARAELEGNARAAEDPEERLVLALLREMDGKLSRVGLDSLGLDVRSHKVAYGLGAFPVFRMGLSDSVALRATIERVLASAGISAPLQEFQGVAYWRAGSDSGHPAPVALYVAVLEDHLAVGVLPLTLESEVLPQFLGLEQRADSDAQARLAELNRAQGYTPHGSVILDLRLLADQFLQQDSLTARGMAASGAYDPASITPECVSEVRGIIGNMPRITGGTTELSTTAVAYQYRFETPATLAGALAKLASPIPAADVDSRRVLDLAFGLRFGAVRDFLLEKATAITQSPYGCEHLQSLNSGAEKTLAQLNQPIPPFVNNFQGLRVSLDEITADQGGLPAGARGHLALHVQQPEMFLGMAQMFLPDLSALGLKAGAPPVRLPESLLPIPGLVAFAAMSGEAIGLSLGEGEEAGLEDYLDRDAGPEGQFLSVSYDSAAYLAYTERLAAHGGDDPDVEGDNAPEHRSDAALAIAQAARGALQDMADRSMTTFSFAPAGLVIDGRMTFKP